MSHRKRYSIIKRQYTAKFKVNADGYVAQRTEDIVGTKEITRTAYFDNDKTFNTNLKAWSNGRWEFYESEDDKHANETINNVEITNFVEVDTFLESNDVYHSSTQSYFRFRWC